MFLHVSGDNFFSEKKLVGAIATICNEIGVEFVERYLRVRSL